MSVDNWSCKKKLFKTNDATLHTVLKSLWFFLFVFFFLWEVQKKKKNCHFRHSLPVESPHSGVRVRWNFFSQMMFETRIAVSRFRIQKDWTNYPALFDPLRRLFHFVPNVFRLWCWTTGTLCLLHSGVVSAKWLNRVTKQNFANPTKVQ